MKNDEWNLLILGYFPKPLKFPAGFFSLQIDFWHIPITEEHQVSTCYRTNLFSISPGRWFRCRFGEAKLEKRTGCIFTCCPFSGRVPLFREMGSVGVRVYLALHPRSLNSKWCWQDMAVLHSHLQSSSMEKPLLLHPRQVYHLPLQRRRVPSTTSTFIDAFFSLCRTSGVRGISVEKKKNNQFQWKMLTYF